MDLGTAFAFATARMPGATAFVEGARRRTYGDWYREIRAAAGGLRELGLGCGDHLVVVMRNRFEMATLYWACQLIGAIFTPVSWRGSPADIAYCIADAEARAVAYDGAARDAAPQAAAKLGIDPWRQVVAADGRGEGVAFDRLLAAQPVDGPILLDERTTCLMLYTSGTTGRPKGVPRSHRAELAAGMSQIAHHHYRPGESTLLVMPLFHTMGVRSLLSLALLNGKVVAMPEYHPEQVLRLAALERISALFLVPTIYHDMLRESAFGRFDLSRLSRVGYAGMAMTPALVERCLAMLKPESFVNHYGSSEIYTFTVCDRLGKPGCAGRAGIGAQLRVVSAAPEHRHDAASAPLPGEPGEILASMRSSEAFAGYWKRPDADAKSIQGEWYRTGDLGRLDADGELYVVGRVDDMIISGGENIYPEEVEDALARSRLVAGVAVVGMPDERLGARVVAFVEPAAAVSTTALEEACEQGGLARFKRPREYVLVKSIPRSASGKILRRRLRSGEFERL